MVSFEYSNSRLILLFQILPEVVPGTIFGMCLSLKNPETIINWEKSP